MPRLSHHPALAAAELIGFLARRAVPGVEEVVDGVYRRSLADGSVLEITPDADVEGDVGAARAILRLDADPDAIVERLGGVERGVVGQPHDLQAFRVGGTCATQPSPPPSASSCSRPTTTAP